MYLTLFGLTILILFAAYGYRNSLEWVQRKRRQIVVRDVLRGAGK
jgi:hypothetical protein